MNLYFHYVKAFRVFLDAGTFNRAQLLAKIKVHGPNLLALDCLGDA